MAGVGQTSPTITQAICLTKWLCEMWFSRGLNPRLGLCVLRRVKRKKMKTTKRRDTRTRERKKRRARTRTNTRERRHTHTDTQRSSSRGGAHTQEAHKASVEKHSSFLKFTHDGRSPEQSGTRSARSSTGVRDTARRYADCVTFFGRKAAQSSSE